MKQIPEALRPMAAYDQFILWRLIDRGDRVDKVPVDYRTGQVDSAHNPAAWLSADAALEAAAETGDGVGFVFTEGDPFFFLDVDHCLVPGGGAWTPTALEVLAKLPGAAVEVSQSGEGLHVFGRTSPVVHGCTNKALGLELYTSGRFVALTGDRAAGSAGVDLTAPLAAVVAEYFPAGAGGSGGGSLDDRWTEALAAGRAESWAGPEDDAELIKRALRSRSAAAAFGSRCSFADLWKRNVDPLMASYPTTDGREYGESEADAALAQHLAFWTGGDCERMARLLWLSKLVRDKWYQRPDYLRRTILNAADQQTSYYVERQARQRIERAAPVLGPEAAGGTGPEKVIGYQYLGADAQIQHFAGCVYVQSLHRAFTPSGALLKSEQFNATFGGYQFELAENGKPTKKAWEAFTESQIVRYPKAESICFRPEMAPGVIVTEENRRLVNTYVPIETTRTPGDPAPFLEHLAKVLPNEVDREILLSYMAAVVQYPGVKFQWCPLLQGAEGNGKTLFTRCVAFAVGHRYTHLPNAKDIDNKFNAWISGKLFVGVEDIYVPENKREVLEALKPLITNDRIEIQAKGSDQITGDNRANFILNTNLRDAIRKTRNDRRFSVFFTAQQNAEDLARDGMAGDYFPNLYAWLRRGGYAIVADYLARFSISDQYNPATNCHRAPETSTTDDAISESLGSIEQEILEAVAEGKPGFAGGWISSMALERLLQILRAGRAIPRNRRRRVLQDIGYDWHPALPDGRVSTVLLVDGGKPRLFIHKDHADRQLATPGEVVTAYERAQAGEGTADPSGFLAATFPAVVGN